MKTGLPRQAMVSRWPTWIGARSTSVVDSASVSRAGLRLSTNGQMVVAAPTTPTAAAVRTRKSRRVPPSWPGETCDCATSVITKPRGPAVGRARPPRRRRSYTVEEAELCDRLPHKSARRRRPPTDLIMTEKHNPVPGQIAVRLALFEPDIPQNTGAVLRLAACFGVAVDLIEPTGFLLDDR